VRSARDRGKVVLTNQTSPEDAMPFMTSFNVYAGGVLVEEISFNGEGRLTKLKDEITLIASNSMGNSVGSITLKYQR